MAVKDIFKEWRVLLLVVVIAISLVGLQPGYVQEDGDYSIQLKGLQDNLGIDFSGGSQRLLRTESGNQSEELADEIAQVLRVRANTMNLPQTTINTINLGDDRYRISLTTAETDDSKINDLINRPGNFQARLPFVFSDESNYTISDTYRFEDVNDSAVRIGRYTDSGLEYYNKTLTKGDYLDLEGTRMYYEGVNGSYRRMEAQIYDDEDVSVSESDSAVRPGSESSYEAVIQLEVSQSSAEALRKIAGNYRGTGRLTMENRRPARLTLFLNGETLERFTVADSFQRQTITDPTITITRNDAGTAREEMNTIIGYLKAGPLPEPVETASSSSIGSTLGTQFMAASVISILGALVAVGLLIFVRYRNPKLALPIVLTGASEVFILFGLWFSTFATLTLSAIAGIIAAVGTGVDDQIIITDESDRTSVKDWKDRMKTAFFVIFTSAASTIGAMVPILSPKFSASMVMAAGIGLIGYTKYSRKAGNHYLVVGAFALAVGFVATNFPLSPMRQITQFATTTILGIMVGITITRPAYAKALEHLD